jgi:cell cycle arrest protein BUB3
MAEIELQLGPTQGISALCFAEGGPTTRSLLVSSWDGSLSLYDADKNALVQRVQAHAAPVLDCCFAHDDAHAVTAGADHAVKLWDLAQGSSTLLGIHAQPVKCAEYAADHGAIISAGWDRAMQLWDPRLPADGCAAAVELPEKVFAMGLSDNRIVLGMAGRHVYVYDLRKLGEVEQERQSSLKYQTRAIRCFPNGQGYGERTSNLRLRAICGSVLRDCLR